jgi:acetyltransferase-like isoleucine patch superfamily enzyme
MLLGIRNFINYLKYKLTIPNVKISYGTIIDKFSEVKSRSQIDKYCRIVNTKIDNSVIIGEAVHITNSNISKFSRVFHKCELYEVSLNSYSYIAPMGYVAYASIGKFCSIGPRFQCAGANHPTDLVSTSPVFYSVNKQCGTTFCDKTTFKEIELIEIMNDVWIGSNVFIKGSVRIGNGAIIASGSVVVKDVPDYAIVGGVPAKIIKFRFEKGIIEKLVKSEWWNFEENELRKLQPKMNSTDILDFLMEINKLKQKA